MVYMEGTKFEMVRFNGPDEMHRIARMALGIGLNWTSEGDAVNDPDNYTEEFEIIDTYEPANSQSGLSRRQCEDIIWRLHMDELCR